MAALLVLPLGAFHQIRSPTIATVAGNAYLPFLLLGAARSEASANSSSSSSSSLPCSEGAGVDVRDADGDGGSDMGRGYRS